MHNTRWLLLWQLVCKRRRRTYCFQRQTRKQHNSKLFLTYFVDQWLMPCHDLFADDWLGDRSLNQYFLGDMINIEATVSQHYHVPLRVYVDQCQAFVHGSNQADPYTLIENGWGEFECSWQSRTHGAFFLRLCCFSGASLMPYTQIHPHCFCPAWKKTNSGSSLRPSCSKISPTLPRWVVLTFTVATQLQQNYNNEHYNFDLFFSPTGWNFL